MKALEVGWTGGVAEVTRQETEQQETAIAPHPFVGPAWLEGNRGKTHVLANRAVRPQPSERVVKGRAPKCPRCHDTSNWIPLSRKRNLFRIRCESCQTRYLWQYRKPMKRMAQEKSEGNSYPLSVKSPSRSDFAKQGSIINLGNERYPRWGVYLGPAKEFPFKKGDKVKVTIEEVA